MRFFKLPALLGAAVAFTAVSAVAYIAPVIFTMAPQLAQDASDMHNYLHSTHPGTLSGFSSHAYDTAMGDLDFEILKLSLGVSTEASVKAKNKAVVSTFDTFKQTLSLEGLKATDPTLKAMWKHLKDEHYVFQTWFKAGQIK